MGSKRVMASNLPRPWPWGHPIASSEPSRATRRRRPWASARSRPVLSALALLALFALARPAAAQAVRGQVVEADTSVPVEGAMVVLLDREAQMVHRVLTDTTGGFVMRVPHPGQYVLRVDRIGYESLVTDAFDVPVNGTFQRVSVPIRPVELVGLDVQGARRCQLRTEQGAATSRVWEEARKALAAAAWTLESGVYRYTLLNFDRQWDDEERRILKEDRRFIRSTGQSPYRSVSPDVLAEGGFVQRDERGLFQYYLPDAASFLSDAFLDTHCMSLKSVRGGEIGLAFEPVRGRNRPDIQGTLWLDAGSAQLQRLEFIYVNLPPDRDMGVARGSVSFGALPNGTWIVRDWSVRMPQLAPNHRRTRVVVAGYNEQGGTVWRAVDRNGTIVVEANAASLSGTAVDSLGSAPLSDVRITVQDGSDQTTGARGAFLFSGMAEGLQAVEAAHPSLDSLGLGTIHFPVEVKAGIVTSVTLRIPGVEEILRSACMGTPPDDRETATVLGRVLKDGVPAGQTPVRIHWSGMYRRGFDVTDKAAPPLPDVEPPVWTPVDERSGWISTVMDHRGVFLVCGVPTGSELSVEVGDGRSPVRRTVEVRPGRSVVIVTLPAP